MRLRSITLGTMLASAAIFTACGGGEFPLTGSDRAAGSDGMLTVEEIEGGNLLVNVQVEHLPPPARIGTGNTTYIGWYTPAGAQAVKAGVLGFDEDDRSGTMQFTTPANRFRFLLTAERNGNVASPSDVVVMQRDVQN